MRPELKLIPPQQGRSPFYLVRGTYLKQQVYRSTGSRERPVARKVLQDIKRQVERGRFEEQPGPTFTDAAIAYMNAGGERRFIEPLLLHFGHVDLRDIDQEAVDRAAASIYPAGTPATRNRQVYTPVVAILKQARIKIDLARPKGAGGTPREAWLLPEETERLLAAAWQQHPRFAALLTFLLYTGCRLSEGLKLKPRDVHFGDSLALIGKTKNGKPRGAYLPPVVLAAIRRALMEPVNGCYKTPITVPRSEGTVFGFTKSGHLYEVLAEVEKASGVIFPDGVSFHIFRHTYGAWGRRYGKLDRAGLVATGAWGSSQGAASYDHIDISAAARAVDLFPGSGASTASVLKVVCG